MTGYFGKILAAAVLILAVSATPSFANNLSVTNVTLGTRDPNAHTVVVTFNVSWQNSWRNKINYDAAWLTVRLINSAASPTDAVLCPITATGLNPAGTSVGTGSNLQIYVPQDAAGAFLQPANPGFIGNVNTQNVQLTVNYQSCGFTDSDQIYASVFGLEMVFIPQGSFYAGDYNASVASLNSGSADSTPWHITSENPIPVTNAASGAYYYVSANNPGEFASGAGFTIPAAFPKGYNAFYVMKYEINEGEWAQFVNSLPAAARINRDLSDNNHKNSTNVIARNTISCAGTPLLCSTQRPGRAVGYLSWMDLAAFLDWDALRPMTELEFEKMSRGPLVPVPGEYIWGNQTIAPAVAISGTTEDGTETITAPANANANYGDTIFTGGDSSLGAGYNQGPLRGGIFAGTNSTRTAAGASFYGVMDLGGNLKERVVTIGNASGLAFTGTDGNGALDTTAGFEGNADVAGWPGMDQGTPANGVDGAAGSGFRGGSWSDGANYLRTSDRAEAARTDTAALNNYGGRGVRTYDGS
ncbi:MAG: hypothetical protein KGJ09_08430 [Candidatus Omnitrophica bacterium]|nr:hypothetical protein [Candidatus Omnitrophota bacterium]MDE2214913.1 hypothetical protein [Candidatus Omnitrophota bacterium]